MSSFAHNNNDLLVRNLYQFIIARLNGDDIPSPHYREEIRRLVRSGIGGFVLFGGERDEVRQFLEELQSEARTPLFIAADIERGVGQQVRGTTLFPCQMAVAAAIDGASHEDVGLLTEVLRSIASEARYVGINLPLIPVLDVNRNPRNPIICTRAFSDDPDTVARFGMMYVRVLEEEGLVSCAKHFPGHGDTAVDSHISLPVIGKSLDDLMETDVMPFRQAIAGGVSSVMVGHLSVPAIDPAPATLSPGIHRLLRNDLGFRGIVMTDALTMNALCQVPEAELSCFLAGSDILLHPEDPDEIVEKMRAKVVSGDLSYERIESSLARIIRRKALLVRKDMGAIDFPRHHHLASSVAGKSVTIVKGEADVIPLTRREDICIFVVGEDGFSLDPSLAALSGKIGTLEGPPATDDIGEKVAIVAIFTHIAAWKGSAGIDAVEQHRIRSIVRTARRSIVVSFGSPYVLRHFPEADVLIAAYEGTENAQHGVAQWLTGSRTPTGRLPVSVAGHGA